MSVKRIFVEVEGIPYGWELVRVGHVMLDESYMGLGGDIIKWDNFGPSEGVYPIIRKIEKPKRYRAFENAAEAEPFFDRKLKYKKHDGSVLRICFLSSKGVHVSKYDYTYEEAFVVFECTDGTPFGIEVTE